MTELKPVTVATAAINTIPLELMMLFDLNLYRPSIPAHNPKVVVFTEADKVH